MTEFSTLYPRRINLLKGIQNFIKREEVIKLEPTNLITSFINASANRTRLQTFREAISNKVYF